jgi:hypothetical protein
MDLRYDDIWESFEQQVREENWTPEHKELTE